MFILCVAFPRSDAKEAAVTTKHDLAQALLRRHPHSHAQELAIDVARNTPAPLFRWLVASLLFSARIAAEQAQQAAAALFEAGWTTPQKMAASTWRQRVSVLNGSGYARYDESTSRYLGEDCDLLLERWKGDLRKLREEAEKDPARERKLLKTFKGIGDTGTDIFFRETQTAWQELHPFADGKALKAAAKLELADDAAGLARLVSQRELPRLLSALVRVDLDKAYDAVRKDAG